MNEVVDLSSVNIDRNVQCIFFKKISQDVLWVDSNSAEPSNKKTKSTY